MNWIDYVLQQANERHKVFISYYHKDDELYRIMFEALYSHLFINKSVRPGEIDTDLSTEYIKRLIQLDYVSDASVVVVLVGPNTRGRKHVDWEVSAGLNTKLGGYSGLLGILLPGFHLDVNGRYYYSAIPARLADNVRTGYAKVYTWDSVTSSEAAIKAAIEDAFHCRIALADRIVNSRRQLELNWQ